MTKILDVLEAAKPDRTTDLGSVLSKIAAQIHSRGVVVVISDFYYDPEKVMEAVRPLAYQGQDVAFFHVLDPAEVGVPAEDHDSGPHT